MGTAFSLAATLAQWGPHSLALISAMMVGTSPLLGSLLLITAGVYQWTPPKQACLEHCRSPLPADRAVAFRRSRGGLLARRFCGRFPHRPATRSLLPRLLLALDGSSVRGRRDEPCWIAALSVKRCLVFSSIRGAGCLHSST
jgi:hypothetical protein